MWLSELCHCSQNRVPETIQTYVIFSLFFFNKNQGENWKDFSSSNFFLLTVLETFCVDRRRHFSYQVVFLVTVTRFKCARVFCFCLWFVFLLVDVLGRGGGGGGICTCCEATFSGVFLCVNVSEIDVLFDDSDIVIVVIMVDSAWSNWW